MVHMRLYIVRHGDPDYANDSLTEQGRAEAKALARYMQAEGIHEIYSSPHGRAWQTAEPAATLLGLEVRVEEWTRELKLPAIYDNVYAAWNVHGSDVRTPEYLVQPGNITAVDLLPHSAIDACVKELGAQSDAFLARQGYERDGGIYRVTNRSKKRIAVFCHGGFGLTWLSVLLEIPLPLVWSGFFMHTSSVTTILFDERVPGIATPRCIGFGATPHLHAAGITGSQAGFVANTE
jgi:broad specificity phosphatase PhoE